jgi:hypothetical protein
MKGQTSRTYLAGVAFVCAVGLLITTLTPAAAARNRNPRVQPTTGHPYGMTYGEWGARWWQWVDAIPADSNPLLDATGASCGIGQSGPVWFLAGTTGGSATRSCTVPTGKAIFFPIFNVLNDYPCPDPSFQPPPGQTMEEFLTEGANAFVSYVTELEVEVDGVSLQNPFDYRATSSLFTFTGDPSLAGVIDPCITGEPQVGVADGYWVMLAPLRVGEHTIHSRAVADFSGFIFEVETTYHLTIAPPE